MDLKYKIFTLLPSTLINHLINFNIDLWSFVSWLSLSKMSLLTQQTARSPSPLIYNKPSYTPKLIMAMLRISTVVVMFRIIILFRCISHFNYILKFSASDMTSYSFKLVIFYLYYVKLFLRDTIMIDEENWSLQWWCWQLSNGVLKLSWVVLCQSMYMSSVHVLE